ncbi:hypothetical protein [Singulisphaera sp. PoT]|uniref:hypothetical protein n=1 Tax=Singulisphaera sp. PoT TaxID=3411797 RepID=UPI003BF5948D
MSESLKAVSGHEREIRQGSDRSRELIKEAQRDDERALRIVHAYEQKRRAAYDQLAPRRPR